jgi:hypothetical protein
MFRRLNAPFLLSYVEHRLDPNISNVSKLLLGHAKRRSLAGEVG